MPSIDLGVLRNQLAAVGSNLWIWLLRTVVRLPPPPFYSAALKDQPGGAPAHQEDGNCVCVEIVGPGGLDQLRACSHCWATCGYNLMKEFDGSQRIPTPLKVVPPGLVVVRNHAFSINYADICIRWGLYESALRYVGWPIIPGFDIAGVVEMAAADTGYKAGDRVFGCSLFGSYSSRVVTSARMLMHLPDNLSFQQGASLPAAAGTALHAASLAGLWPNEPIAKGKSVLIHSAAGGVGAMLCQVLRLQGRSKGLQVVGVVGSASKVSSCAADKVIDKSSEDWVAAARAHAPDGYCAIFDANGVSSLSSSYQLLSCNGRLVVYGFHSNLPKVDGGLGMLSPWTWICMGLDMLRMPRYDAMDLTLQSKAVLGFNLSFFADEHDLVEAYIQQIGRWVAAGALHVPPVQDFSFEETRAAQGTLQSGRTVGKMVVTL